MDLVKINIGETGGDGQGDTLRDALAKFNQNMDVIEAALTGVPSAGDLADVVAQIPAISTVPATIDGEIDNETVSPKGVKAAIFAQLGAAYTEWFATLPTDPSALSSGDFWKNGGTLAQVP